MTSRTNIRNAVSLTEVLPDATFSERHDRVIAAPPEQVWQALTALSWNDLRLTLPLIAIRTAGRARAARAPMLARGPVDEIAAAPPRSWVGARIGKPWQPRPEFVPGPLTLDQIVAFDEPGWLKYGMEFRLDPLRDGRTFVTTTTRCTATDAVARRRFARYWRVIRPFSGLVRRDMLHALAVAAERGNRHPVGSAVAGDGDHGDHP
jgi:hypothetical protein